MFAATNRILSSQTFCRGKHTFVATKDVFCRDKRVCCDKNIFVATKMILVAARANDKCMGHYINVCFGTLAVEASVLCIFLREGQR